MLHAKHQTCTRTPLQFLSSCCDSPLWLVSCCCCHIVDFPSLVMNLHPGLLILKTTGFLHYFSQPINQQPAKLPVWTVSDGVEPFLCLILCLVIWRSSAQQNSHVYKPAVWSKQFRKIFWGGGIEVEVYFTLFFNSHFSGAKLFLQESAENRVFIPLAMKHQVN